VDEKIGGEMGDVFAQIVVIVAALNWASVEFLGTDLLQDTLALDQGTLTLVIAGIGVAAVISAYNLAVWQGWIE
jgi:uncharacterized membrane protein YuzA (DUF378 family)